ncbi:MAG: hypothetical protein GF331_22115, partial [Chitinivibrionales bacterium]|nr:hypothetical protein [Chitinivibrionales bacterium]
MKLRRRTLVTIGLWVGAALVWAAVIGADVTSRQTADSLRAAAESARAQDSAAAVDAETVDTPEPGTRKDEGDGEAVAASPAAP